MIIIITGASKGMGAAIAAQFAQKDNTLLLCSRTASALEALAASLREQFPWVTIKTHAADLSIPASAKAFGQWCLAQGTPDILINNAGQFIPGQIHNEPEGILDTMLQTNLYSAYHLTRTIVPAMIAAGRGHIFNICSIASLHAYSNGGSYSISKYAMAGFSKNLREELKPNGIKVTAVYPGATYTSSWDGSDVQPERIMEADDIAKMIYAAAQLSPMAVVEDIVLRPQLGDL